VAADFTQKVFGFEVQAIAVCALGMMLSVNKFHSRAILLDGLHLLS